MNTILPFLHKTTVLLDYGVSIYGLRLLLLLLLLLLRNP
jgi:hypothetical protein